ncbi:helix-turn-helix domain-containing protein [Streptomyces sp. NPDC001102]
MTVPTPSHAHETVAPGDLGRRLARRREDLGLTREETAARAGMALGYLQYLEERPTAAPGTSTLLRLAGALRTTLTELTGGEVEVPPGPARAARHAELIELTPQQCRALLATHGVGRIAVPTAEGPLVVPVNYSVVDGAIVFRTAPGTLPAQAAGCRVAFEVDRIDDVFSQGWSVLVRGLARTVTDPGAVRRLTEQARGEPWAGGRRDTWVRIEPLALSGRRITV